MPGDAMLLIVHHMTRMQRGYFCVAGIDHETERHVRPTLPGRLSIDLLARHGGPFDLATVVDLGPTRPIGIPPETEDHQFFRGEVHRVIDMPPGEFWELLVKVSATNLAEIFGPTLTRRGPRSLAVDLGLGRCSLGCLRTTARPRLYLNQRPDRPPQVRLRLADPRGELGGDLDLGVPDIRLYAADHVTPDQALIRRVADRLRKQPEAVLAVGLTRPYAATPDQPPLHWLQVNNIHLPDEPCWRLG
jgi:hypothetical protein